MSGGFFEYNQYRIDEIADAIDRLIARNGSGEKDEWGDPMYQDFSQETIEKFKEAIEALKRAETMAQRIDWLVSGDDGEESFHRRWAEELEKLNET